MNIYQSTPDYYREYIEHGWFKDQAAKVHKYIKRWRNKAGKWVYKYKNELQDAKTRRNRKNAGLNPDDVSSNINGKNYGASPRGGIVVRSDDGKVKSYSNYSRIAARARSTDQPKNAIRAGRQRAKLSSAMKGDSRYKRKKTNLSSQGYSGSQGSGEYKRLRNLGTRHSAKNKYTYIENRMNYNLDRQDINGGFYNPSSYSDTVHDLKLRNPVLEKKKKKITKATNNFRKKKAKRSAIKARNYRKNMNSGGTEWSNLPSNWNRSSRESIRKYW